MSKRKQKKLDEKIIRFFREAADNITTPSSQKLWNDLKQRLEKKELWAAYRQSTLQKTPGFYTSLVKNKPFAAVIVASFILVIIFSRILPASPLNNFVTDFFSFSPLQQAQEGKEEETVLHSRPQAVNDLELEELGQGRGQKERRQKEAEITEMATMDAKIDEDEIKAVSPESPAEKSFAGENQYLSAEAPPQEVVYKEQEDFAAAIDEVKNIAPEEIWEISSPPQGFDFKEGSLRKTKKFLFQVKHHFTDQDGKILTLTQDFFAAETVEEEMVFFTQADAGPAQPKQVGPFRGYYYQLPEELKMLTWQQDYSIVTVRGQLEEKALLSLPGSLKTR